MHQKGQRIGQQVAQGQHQSAECQEIDHRSSEQTQQDVDTHFAVGGGDDVQKQDGGHHGPEQQIQRGAKQRQPQPLAKQAKQVIQHPDPQPE